MTLTDWTTGNSCIKVVQLTVWLCLVYSLCLFVWELLSSPIASVSTTDSMVLAVSVSSEQPLFSHCLFSVSHMLLLSVYLKTKNHLIKNHSSSRIKQKSQLQLPRHHQLHLDQPPPQLLLVLLSWLMVARNHLLTTAMLQQLPKLLHRYLVRRLCRKFISIDVIWWSVAIALSARSALELVLSDLIVGAKKIKLNKLCKICYTAVTAQRHPEFLCTCIAGAYHVAEYLSVVLLISILLLTHSCSLLTDKASH